MTDTTATAASTDREVLAERLVADTTATMEMFGIHLGRELGLYAALQETEGATAGGLATAAGIHPRYAREWLEQQAVAGLLTVDDPGAPADERLFRLPGGVAEVMLDGTSPYYVGPLAQAIAGIAGVLGDLPGVYRTGGGVPFDAFGRDLRRGIGTMNRAMFDNDLGGWLETMPDVAERLRGDAEPRVLDLGCGTGASSIALARLFPRATVLGVDLDGPSIDEARANAVEAGMSDRVMFTTDDAAVGVDGERGFDLVTIFEALHDMGDPVGVLRAARDVLAPGGAVLVADERTADAFAPDGDLIERFFYGWSVTHCLPATMAEDPVVASGTVLREATVREWADAAGLATTTVLGVDNDFWRFYRLSR